MHPRVRLLMFTVSIGLLVTACATSQAPAPPGPDTRAVLPVDVARESLHTTSESVDQVLTQIGNCTAVELAPCYQSARRSIEITGRVRAALEIAGKTNTASSRSLEADLDKISDSAIGIITRCAPETFKGATCQDEINSLKYLSGGLLYTTNNASLLDR